jgi:hypothetical protein
MRLAPAAIVARGDPDRAAALGRAQSKVTHVAEECHGAADVSTRILSAATAGGGLDALPAAKPVKYRSAMV